MNTLLLMLQINHVVPLSMLTDGDNVAVELGPLVGFGILDV